MGTDMYMAGKLEAQERYPAVVAENRRLKASIEELENRVRQAREDSQWCGHAKRAEELEREVERLKGELQEALKWKDKMTEVAGRNRERAEAAEAKLAEAQVRISDVEGERDDAFLEDEMFSKMAEERDQLEVDLAAEREAHEQTSGLLRAAIDDYTSEHQAHERTREEWSAALRDEPEEPKPAHTTGGSPCPACEAEDVPRGAQVIDLMQALKDSLAAKASEPKP